MRIETEDGIVELWQDVSYSFSGWSDAIQPERREPGEPKTEPTLWLNTYLSWNPPIDVTITVGDA